MALRAGPPSACRPLPFLPSFLSSFLSLASSQLFAHLKGKQRGREKDSGKNMYNIVFYFDITFSAIPVGRRGQEGPLLWLDYISVWGWGTVSETPKQGECPRVSLEWFCCF